MSGHIVEGGSLKIDLFDVIERMQDVDKEQMLRALLCDRVVVDSIVGQIVDGCDSEGSSTYQSTIEECRLKIIEQLDAVTMRAVRRLVFDRDSAEAEAKRYRDWAFVLFHAWPKGMWGSRPEMPAFASTDYPDEAAARAAIAKAKGDA